MFPKVVWRKKLRSFDTSNIMTFCQIFEVASRVRQKVVDHKSLTIEKCSVQEKKSLETKGRWWQGRWWQDLLYCLCGEENVGIVNVPAYIPVYRQVCGRPIILYTLSCLLSQHRAASPVGVPTCDYVIGYTVTWKATDCGFNLFISKYLRIKNDRFVLFS